MKKIFYGIGAIATVVTPVIAVVSCGNASKEGGYKKNFNLNLDDIRPPKNGSWDYYFDGTKQLTPPTGLKLNIRAEYSLEKNIDNPTNVFYVLKPSKFSIENLNDIISSVEGKLLMANGFKSYSSEENPELFHYANTSDVDRIDYLKSLFNTRWIVDFIVEKAKNNDVDGTPVKWSMSDGDEIENFIYPQIQKYVESHTLNSNEYDLNRKINEYHDMYDSKDFNIAKLPKEWGIFGVPDNTWEVKPVRIEKFSAVLDVQNAIDDLIAWKNKAIAYNTKFSAGFLISGKTVYKGGYPIYTDQKNLAKIVVDKDNNWYATTTDGVIIKNGRVFEYAASSFVYIAVSPTGDFYWTKWENGKDKLFKNNQSVFETNQITSICVDENGDWYVGALGALYKNGQEIFNKTNSAIMSVATDASGNWYIVTGDKKVFKNGQEVSAPSNIYDDTLSLDKNGNWYCSSDSGDIYKNGVFLCKLGFGRNSINTDIFGNYYVLTEEHNLYMNGELIHTGDASATSAFSINEWGSKTGNW